ncbi:hypothetical protein CKM354_000519900 [Cercospora kikuchii]|uniref:Lysophospholipase n=1 Tax=Cercospora kikuchii TaxID=84275 RepID=A0A9P3CFF1_9PEZI|nr:uncharacterized protein CKM354_000519900 [Cercospora kikuchii]GIZ41914.1 hypothetical protein CKM354_000519900 [Cercospora kikuchii]
MRTDLPAVFALSIASANAFSLPWKRQAGSDNPYVPTSTSCPSSASIRVADSLNPDEESYAQERLTKASQDLSSWLGRTLDGFSSNRLPKLALALSGGGTKAGLTTAGAVYGLDGRESSDSPVAGLLQGMTYVSALSGGSLTLSGIMSNNFAQVSTLRDELLEESYQNIFSAPLTNADAIRADVGNKTAAGYPASLIDIYGKVISYNFISATGGNGLHWSNVTSQSSFQDHSAPYPIITITQANVAAGMCSPNETSAIWEVAPLEFGSWDSNVDAFYPTQYMGSVAGNSSQCTTGFDNTGFITAISSNILIDDTCSTGNESTDSLSSLAGTVNTAFSGVSLVNPYGIVPNPFYQSSEAGPIRDQQDLFGTDGGDSGQAIPVFPFLQPERNIDVIVLVDAATQQPGNITNGTWLYNTYTSAQEKNLTRMPQVPTPSEFVAANLSSRAQFYGCNDNNTATLIYLPNTELGEAPTGFQQTAEQVNATFEGGVAMVTQSQQNSTEAQEWAACLACAIVHKSVEAADLPEVCTGCLERYCWPRGNETESGGSGGNGGGNGTDSGSGSGSGSENGAAGIMFGANQFAWISVAITVGWAVMVL